ncbi:hypothetical protein KUD97_03420 [Desulfovibrio desulfuricans]|nr:hypothetical protein [Desulfovibrio desulfuricans]MEA4991820.1 hypothetical protein [Desulfovibrio desulfuricans]UIB00715.1 hypothetical protein KUD97_03420 [Desulfovibrio desulfuricans]
MRNMTLVLLAGVLLLPACGLLQHSLWRPETLVPVETDRAHAVSMIHLCAKQGYKGQAFASLPESKNAQCQPRGRGQECAMLLEYPEDRYFSFVDARSYTAMVQAKTLFNVGVDNAGNIKQCRTETE